MQSMLRKEIKLEREAAARSTKMLPLNTQLTLTGDGKSATGSMRRRRTLPGRER